MEPRKELLAKVERIKAILVDRATGGQPSDDEYSQLRQDLASSSLRDVLPRFVLTSRTVREFWGFIQPKFPSYRQRAEFLQKEFEPLLNSLELGEVDEESILVHSDLFKHQFPAGLPFGLKKPSLAVTSQKGLQRTQFETEKGIGVLREGIYPSFTFKQLCERLDVTKLGYSDWPTALTSSIQTETEKTFFMKYANTFNMRSTDIPVLIPQAWIQWHSKTKQDLRSTASSYADELYRVDFVAFWDNRRYAIPIDDISHYAKRSGKTWEASEVEYSKRLREDRKLRKTGWQVFRVSNWEMRSEDAIPEILSDLKEFIGF
ncbi:MAG TPA: hypothetical protein VI793_21120 [Anaerolineales bacterium]|nr:hypothetical protein [Anaerolineales bacterium]